MDEGESSSQSLSEYLRELDERNRCSTAAPRVSVRVPEPTQGEGGGTGQTMREVLEELYGRNKKDSACTSLEIRMSEDVPPILQETASRARKEEVLQPTQEVSEEVRQQELKAAQSTDGHGPRRYRQRTKITGVNPMDMPGVAARIAQVHEEVLLAGRRHAGDRLMIGPRYVDVHRRI